MKQIITFIQGLLLFSFLIGAAGLAGYIETHYTQYGVVTDIENDVAIIVDAVGNEWAYSSDDLKIGDYVKISMDNHCTDNTLKDDIILKVTVDNE